MLKKILKNVEKNKKKGWKNKKSSLVDRASKVRQTTNNKMKRILNEATWLVNTKLNSCVKYPDSLICFYCVEFDTCKVWHITILSPSKHSRSAWF